MRSQSENKKTASGAGERERTVLIRLLFASDWLI